MDHSKSKFVDSPDGASQAPEVVASYQPTGADGLQAIDRPASEGMQAVDVRPYYSPQPPYSLPTESNSSGEKEYAGQVPLDERPTLLSPPRRKNRRWWIIGGSIAVLLIVIAVAVGVGVGVTQSGGSGGTSLEGSSSTSTGTGTSPSLTATATTSSTTSAVTSGATGLAQFSCEPDETVTSSEDVDYTQACYTQYQTGGKSFYNESATIVNVGGAFIRYTFRDCIDACDSYNMDRSTGDAACRAVSYYANITVPIDLYAGNCFLKTGRGVAYNGDPFDYQHTASAYWSCLDDETCIQ